MSAHNILVQYLGGKCTICGSIEKLVLHHADQDRKNNAIENIQLLCDLCHREKHGFMENGKNRVVVGKVGNSLRITLPSPITEQLDIKKGDILYLSLDNSTILVEKES